MTSLLLALAGAALVAGALGLWVRWLRRVALEGRRPVAWGMVVSGMALAAAALLTGPGLAAGVLAGLALLAGATWAVLGALAIQSRQTPRVAVGEPLPDVTAPDAEGRPFRLADLRGHPALIKLFRGHW